MFGCCGLCCEESTLRSVLVPRKKLLWSFVTPGNSDDEGYGDVRFIAQARLASARTQYRAETHKHISTKRDPRGCLLGRPRIWDFRMDPRTLDCLLGEVLTEENGCVPQITEDIGEEFKIGPQEQFPDRICEQIVDVTVPPVDAIESLQLQVCPDFQ